MIETGCTRFNNYESLVVPKTVADVHELRDAVPQYDHMVGWQRAPGEPRDGTGFES
jgi:hypothetical protein